MTRVVFGSYIHRNGLTGQSDRELCKNTEDCADGSDIACNDSKILGALGTGKLIIDLLSC